MNSYNKYNNQPVDGFQSHREAARYKELMLLHKAGEISNLRLQVPFKIIVNGTMICKYISDFVYEDSAGKTHVEDAKGMPTAVYQLKRKLMKACHGVDIEEV